MSLRHYCANVLCTITVHKSCTDDVIISLLNRDHFLIVGIYFSRLRRTQLRRPSFMYGQRFRYTLDRKKNSSVNSEYSDNFDIVLSVRVTTHIVSEMSLDLRNSFIDCFRDSRVDLLDDILNVTLLWWGALKSKRLQDCQPPNLLCVQFITNSHGQWNDVRTVQHWQDESQETFYDENYFFQRPHKSPSECGSWDYDEDSRCSVWE